MHLKSILLLHTDHQTSQQHHTLDQSSQKRQSTSRMPKYILTARIHMRMVIGHSLGLSVRAFNRIALAAVSSFAQRTNVLAEAEAAATALPLAADEDEAAVGEKRKCAAVTVGENAKPTAGLGHTSEEAAAASSSSSVNASASSSANSRNNGNGAAAVFRSSGDVKVERADDSAVVHFRSDHCLQLSDFRVASRVTSPDTRMQTLEGRLVSRSHVRSWETLHQKLRSASTNTLTTPSYNNSHRHIGGRASTTASNEAIGWVGFRSSNRNMYGWMCVVDRNTNRKTDT
jgi:hypothetical protein